MGVESAIKVGVLFRYYSGDGLILSRSRCFLSPWIPSQCSGYICSLSLSLSCFVANKINVGKIEKENGTCFIMHGGLRLRTCETKYYDQFSLYFYICIAIDSLHSKNKIKILYSCISWTVAIIRECVNTWIYNFLNTRNPNLWCVVIVSPFQKFRLPVKICEKIESEIYHKEGFNCSCAGILHAWF